MYRARLFVFASLTLLLLCVTSFAQTPGPQFWRRLSCEPYEPRTKLESLEFSYDTVIVKGFTRITTIDVRGVRVDAVEMRENNSQARVKGIVIALREGGDHLSDNRAFIDYDEIDSLVRAIDSLSRIDETVTKLAGFEARYLTHGEFEMNAFRQTNRGAAITLTTGICDKPTQTLTLDEFAKFRALIVEAKMRLDEIR